MRLSSIWFWLRSSATGLLTLALLVGAGAGGGAIVFRWLIQTFTRLFTGFDDYSAQGHAANPHLPGLGRWFVLLAPVVAGLLYGPLVHFFAREARGHGVPEVMYAVARRGGRIAPQVAGVKALASALCIGGGGSVGREGPIVQIGSALGSTLGRLTRVAEPRMRVLVACGAAGGIAATFNAPLAGVFFAMELILRDFTAESFGMVVVSSVTASVIGRAALGDAPFLQLPSFHVEHLGQYGLFILLGLLAGGAGVLFTRVLYAVEDLCDAGWRFVRLPEWARPALGGLLLGGLLLVLPEMYGVGYPVLGNGIAGAYAVGFLVVLMLGKMLATSLTIGIGGSGGVFAPSLFIGAMLGSAYGQVAHQLAPGLAGPAGAYGLIGMGAVFAGAARAPITAVVIMFELTGEYSIILPLMAAIVLATGVSKLLSHDTIYTLKLRRRGVDLDEPERAAGLVDRTVDQVVRPLGPTVRESDRLADVSSVVARSALGRVLVVDDDGDYRGVLTARALADTLADGRHETAQVRDVAEASPTVTSTDTLDTALDALEAADGAVPVRGADGVVVGWLSHQAVLAARHPGAATPTVGGWSPDAAPAPA
ncbi:chloride channel protein [Luteimicrobium xylanilyticum]|uniref:Chloride channel protein CLC-e n=1 Tax=Luteimicrobium xylanilyticum TaxID=1133546 RepID=A0A5P9QFB7_9MICO|nr:chloride channel protein [Luteimicrobium xylanilyticum]QFV00199.1 Chloride channel protein CLC-e [Luteimicrobium xylanilyticum]